MTKKQINRLFIKYKNQKPGMSREGARSGFKALLEELGNPTK
jgi:hypothetical protein